MIVIKGNTIEMYKLPKKFNYNYNPTIKDYSKLIKSYSDVKKYLLVEKF